MDGDDEDGSPAGGEAGDFYEILGVSPEAPPAVIEQSYRDAAKRHHPDASELPEAEAETRFRQVLAAREVLTNPETRRAYDDLGHVEYCRQTDASTGIDRPVSTDGSMAGQAADSGAPEPEPRPEPDAEMADDSGHDQYSDDAGRIQTSALGRAQKRGDTTVTSPRNAFGGTRVGAEPGQSAQSSAASDDGDGNSHRGMDRDIYEVGVADGSMSGRSLQVIATRWGRSWQLRGVVGLGLLVLLVALEYLIGAVLAPVGWGETVPRPTTAWIYGLTLLGVVGASLYSCLRVEQRLSRGAFLSDRDLGRFSRRASRRAQNRGFLALFATLGVSAVLAVGGTRPWQHVSATLRGNDTGFPWFDIAALPWLDAGSANLEQWETGLDLLLSAAFVTAAVLGTLALALGLSVELWRVRYDRGLPVRPSVGEGILAGAVLTVPMGFVADSTTLGSLPQSLSPRSAASARLLAIQEGHITIQTLGVVAIVLLLVTWVTVVGLRAWVARTHASE